MQPLTVTVSQLNRYLKAVMDEDKKLTGLFVKGEISNFVRHRQSGHCYFSLKDAGASLRAVMFRSHAEDLRFSPEDGLSVLAQGSVGVFERDGVYQLYVTDMQPEGAGALALAFEQVKARLAKDGMFDAAYKRPLPRWPRRIGVVTSETGAAIRDIQNVLARRYPMAKLLLCSAAVQGKGAPETLTRALRTLDSASCDVIILGRGGGSAEDLAAFNDEGLARAVFAAKTPVVSAVGHETDVTICDFVADLRAPTPSAAAELCTPSAVELAERLEAMEGFLRREAAGVCARAARRLDELVSRRVLRDPRVYLLQNVKRLDFLSGKMYNNKCMFLRSHRDKIARRAALLDSLSPLRVLERGYCAAQTEDRTVTSAGQVRPGDSLSVRFSDGIVHTVVERVESEGIREGGARDGEESGEDL